MLDSSKSYLKARYQFGSNSTSVPITGDNKMLESININENVQAYLDYYCNLSHPPHYAVLLKGDWGVGKTWLIKKYCERLKKHDKKYLYVSLYGITNYAEIDYAIFQQLHPLLSSKGMELTGKIFRGLLKLGLKIDLNSDSKEDGTVTLGIPDVNFPEYLKNTSQNILIFDDLERCKIEIESVLGYINYFVEHQGLKVIIIANESEIFIGKNNNEVNETRDNEDGKSNRYLKIKEKLIGKTLEVSADLRNGLLNLIDQVNNEQLKNFLRCQGGTTIQDVYGIAEYKNLRTLEQVIWDFERIYDALPDKAKEKPEVLDKTLGLLAAFLIEIKRGNLIASEIFLLREHYISALTVQSRQRSIASQGSSPQPIEKNKNNNITQFVTKYSSFELYDPFPSEEWWGIFLDKGIIDNQKLAESVSNSKYFQDKTTPNWMKLWHFFDLKDDQFVDLLKQVEVEFQEKKFTSLGEIKHVVSLFLLFSKIGLYDKDEQEILQNAKNYIDNLDDILEGVSLNYNLEPTEQKDRSYQSLGFAGKELPEFQEFCDYIRHRQKSDIIKTFPAMGHKLLQVMQSDPHRFRRMICLHNLEDQKLYSEDHNFYEVPILRYIPPEAFIQALLRMIPAQRRWVIRGMKERYSVDQINQKLIEEYEWLQSVRTRLSEEAQKRQKKLSGYTLNLFLQESEIEQSIEKLRIQRSKHT